METDYWTGEEAGQLLDEIDSLKRELASLQAIEQAARAVCADADGYEFVLSENELKNLEKLARLVLDGDE